MDAIGSATLAPRSTRPRLLCEADGCAQATSERKPFCADHVEHMPHVILLKARMRKRARELSRPTAKSSIAKEILARFRLEATSSTPRALSVWLGIPELAAGKYTEILLRKGLLKRAKGRLSLAAGGGS